MPEGRVTTDEYCTCNHHQLPPSGNASWCRFEPNNSVVFVFNSAEGPTEEQIKVSGFGALPDLDRSTGPEIKPFRWSSTCELQPNNILTSLEVDQNHESQQLQTAWAYVALPGVAPRHGFQDAAD